MSREMTDKKIDDIIKRNIKLFHKAGVLSVRPGFKMTGGWITDKKAIVVTVNKKIEGLSNKQMLPAELEDVPVDVREATGLQRLRAKSPTDLALVKVHARVETHEPNWKLERAIPSGKLVASTTKTIAKLPTQKSVKQNIKYKPASVPLKKFTGKMTIIAYASPDDGFTVLQNFIKQTKSSLNIAMYDFTSADLLNTVTAAIKPGKLKYQMVLDHPPRNPTANQPDDVTRAAILNADPNAAINWALTRNNPVVTEWIYPSAYHIKVVVRDEKSFWLSSGNFNVSNQPNLKANDPKRGSLKNADRDWHVIVLNEKLAQLFNAYIINDFDVAKQGQGVGDNAQHTAIKKALKNLQTESNQSSFNAAITKPSKQSMLGTQKIFTNVPVTIQPLLTPDLGKNTTMYVDNVLALIKSAKRSVYMQTQYIHPSDLPVDKDFMLLVEALSDAHKKGLDVRLITSQFENTAQWVEKLKEFDLDHVLRIQNRVHNKGIVVDSKVVMVSSQNWSAAGVLRNRDAGLIIDNAAIAEYFEAIFLDDWINRSAVKIVDVSHPVKIEAKNGTKAAPAKAAAKKIR